MMKVADDIEVHAKKFDQFQQKRGIVTYLRRFTFLRIDKQQFHKYDKQKCNEQTLQKRNISMKH